jgi:mono/diheme cytochrome c family protein
MNRRAAVYVLWLCGWVVACGSGNVQPAADASESGSSRPELLYNTREGRTVFLHYCAPCHGEAGRGDGFNAYNLDPKPRNLSDPEFQELRTDEDLAMTIRAGGRAAGLSNAMPPWGRTLNDRRIHNVVRFIRTLSAGTEEE